MRIRPAEGRTIRDPASGNPIPRDGVSVQENSFWSRRIKDGDVLLIEESLPVAPIAEPSVKDSKQSKGGKR